MKSRDRGMAAHRRLVSGLLASSGRPAKVSRRGQWLVVAARLHEYTFRPLAKDRRWEERMYWCSSLIGSVLAITAMIPRSVPGAVAIGFVTLWSTFLYRPGGPNQRRRWER